MDYNYRCMGCMQEQYDFSVPCPHCGYVEQPNKVGQLPVRSILHNTYIIGKALGAGGFGITYIGFDVNLLKRVCIKEYFLSGISWRDRDGYTVCCNTEYSQRFEYEKKHFIEEARVLAQLDDQPGVVKVLNYFEANQTAYIVMDYVEGQSLRSYIRSQGGKLSPIETFSLLRPVVQALASMHAKGIVHLDISPSNIMLTGRGVAKLIDFGAAKGRNKDLNADKVFKKSYSPIEQRTLDGQIGTYSDVYALCATFYEILTGQKATGSLERQAGEVMYTPRQYGIPITEEQEHALIAGLALNPQERTQSATDLYFYLYAQDEPTASQSNIQSAMQNSQVGTKLIINALQEEQQRRKKQKTTIGILAVALSVLILLGVGIILLHPFGNKKDNASSQVAVTSVDSTTTPEITITDSELRDAVYDKIDELRASDGVAPAVRKSSFEKVAKNIADECVSVENPNSNTWSKEVQAFVNSELAANNLSMVGWLIGPLTTTDTDDIVAYIESQIASLNNNADGAIDLRNCVNLGISCRSDAAGVRYWVIIYL